MEIGQLNDFRMKNVLLFARAVGVKFAMVVRFLGICRKSCDSSGSVEIPGDLVEIHRNPSKACKNHRKIPRKPAKITKASKYGENHEKFLDNLREISPVPET